jgi:uncharacterized protein (DUF58 family)
MRPAAATALLGLGFILAAAVFDAEPLYVAGVAFAALAGGSVVWVWAGARGLRLTRTIGAHRVLEEQPVTIDVEVTAGRLTLPVGLIEDDLLPGPAPIAARGRVTRVRIEARFARRGTKRLPPPRVVVSDPFGIATRTVVGDEADELLVLPRILPVTAPGGSGDGTGLAARRARRSAAAEVDLDGLRPYREGAAASRIFWPGVARGGEMMERRLRADGDTRPLVVLDPRGALVEDDLDAAVRAAASLCVHLARRGGCALLLPGDRRPTALEPSLGGWTHLHVRLALVGADRAPSTAGLGTRRGPVLYVAARVPARPPRALAHAPGGGRLLIVPGRYGTLPAVFEVAGCTAYELSGARQRTEVA